MPDPIPTILAWAAQHIVLPLAMPRVQKMMRKARTAKGITWRDAQGEFDVVLCEDLPALKYCFWIYTDKPRQPVCLRVLCSGRVIHANAQHETVLVPLPVVTTLSRRGRAVEISFSDKPFDADEKLHLELISRAEQLEILNIV